MVNWGLVGFIGGLVLGSIATYVVVTPAGREAATTSAAYAAHKAGGLATQYTQSLQRRINQ